MDQSKNTRRTNSEDEEEEEEENEDDEDSRSDYSQNFEPSEDSGESSDSSSDRSAHLCPAAQLLIAKRNNAINNHMNAKALDASSTNAKEKSKSKVQRSQNRSCEIQYQRNQTAASGRMDSLFVPERLSEEDEDQDEDDRPIRSNLKVREDTMDGAENPDTDPPQRRKTLEDISITELSALGASMPPGEHIVSYLSTKIIKH